MAARMTAPSSPPSARSDPSGPAARHCILIGLRGVGKTTVGRLLAERLDRPFHDLDDLALASLRATSVRDVFATRGEPAWRSAEREAFDAAITDADRPLVLALGGGAPMIDALATRLRDLALRGAADVVLLECPAEIAAERLGRDPGDRPSITGRGIVEELATLLAERIERYRAVATLRVDVADADPAEAVRRVDGALARQ